MEAKMKWDFHEMGLQKKLVNVLTLFIVPQLKNLTIHEFKKSIAVLNSDPNLHFFPNTGEFFLSS
jgi:hypothetical protein